MVHVVVGLQQLSLVLQCAKLGFFGLDLFLQEGLDFEAFPVAVLDKVIAVEGVHFDQLFCFFVRLVVVVVLGADSCQHFLKKLVANQFPHILTVVVLTDLILVVYAVQYADPVLMELQHAAGLVLLKSVDGGVGLDGGLLRAKVLVVEILFEEILLVVEFPLFYPFQLIEFVGVVFDGLQPVLFVLHLELHLNGSCLEPLPHVFESFGLKANVEDVLFSSFEQFGPVGEGLGQFLLIKYYLLFHLIGHCLGALYAPLHHPVLLPVQVQLAFQLVQVATLLLHLAPPLLNAAQRQLFQRITVPPQGIRLVQNAHLAAVRQVGLHLTSEGRLLIDQLHVSIMRGFLSLQEEGSFGVRYFFVGRFHGQFSLFGVVGEEIVVFVIVMGDVGK